MLFTLAHELAHVLLHHDFRENFVTVDDDEHDEPRRGKDRSEAFADAFASALLVPPKGLGVALKAIRKVTGAAGDSLGDIEILYVSHIFGVSFQVAASRCEAYGILPAGGGAALYKQLQREHGSPEKRAQAAGLPQRPEIRFPPVSRVLLEHAIRRIHQGAVSIGRAAEALNVTVSELTAFNAVPLQ
jgi:Zn-dependent peptidase ImmA (M78 family)